MAKILIADDDIILTEMLKFQLENAGYIVLSAQDGVAALDAVKNDCVDLIILDSMMPVVAGPEVLARLKADPETAKIPIVMLTARNNENDVVTALKGGASEYLTKPFIPQELLIRIEKHLKA